MFESIFQSFTESADPSHGAERARKLRAELARRGLDGFIVPRSDEHQNEYVPPCAERLAWLTGFTGSAGLAIVLKDKAAVFVDGRYTLQVRDQVDTKVFDPVAIAETSAETWIGRSVAKGAKLGFDPWLTTQAQLDRYERAARAAGSSLVAVDDNPVDAVWEDRPAPPRGQVVLHPKKFAGVEASKKLEQIASALKDLDGLVISDPHAVAWAFNIRGADVAHTPLPLSFAIVPAKGRPTLYIEAAKLSNAVRDALEDLAHVEQPDALDRDLHKLGAQKKKLRFDSATAPVKLVKALRDAGGEADLGSDPVSLMKAVKNAAELRGAVAAHVRDGAAVVRFLAWFDEATRTGRITEIDAVMALETFRRETRKLKEVSFPSISGAGAHGAIVHYRVTEKTDVEIRKGLFLIDSGAQYEDGTTDITRTIAVGKPSAEMRDRFTRVLKGHIAVVRAVFPRGTSGTQLDTLARASLWDAGLDFDHGTGHGVGSYLSVHEGPQRISKVASVALQPGMILSNEPGYYKAGAYGIRIENLIVVTKVAVKGAEREMYGFDTLTLVPIDRNLVEAKLLSRDELAWLNAYHARVRKTLAPMLDAKARKWLTAATKPIR
jgi:Xaa-Pro aminopeptidase